MKALAQEFVDIATQEDNTVIKQPILSAVLSKYGGIPSSFFVRKEARIVWNHLKCFRKSGKKVAVVGSPGVGKSVLLVMFAFYMCLVEKKKFS